MKCPWDWNKCILCLENNPLTKEHIIPSQIGGLLWCKFLCKSCNDFFGYNVEKDLRKDPAVRIALEKLKPELGELYYKINEGLNFVAESGRGLVAGKYKGRDFHVKMFKEEDNSIIQSTKYAKKQIAKELKKQKVNDDDVSRILSSIDNSPLEKANKITEDIEIIKWGIDSIRPDLTDINIDDLIPLKIGYEFLACHLGPNIYHNAFDDIRNILLSGNSNPNFAGVEHLTSREYKPFHGIAIESGQPFIRIIIRLFGWLTFRVKFHTLPLQKDLIMWEYIVDLGNREEYLRKV